MSDKQGGLRAIRLRRGMAMKSLAQRAGVGISAVSHVEAGRNLLSADLARKSAEALGVDALTLMIANNEITLKERIVSGVDSPRRAVGFVHTLLELLESAELTPDQRKAAKEAASSLTRLVEERISYNAGTSQDWPTQVSRKAQAQPTRIPSIPRPVR